MMQVIGLAVIALSWAYQAYYTSKKDKHIRTNFLILYIVGSALLVIDGMLFAVSVSTLLNTTIVLLSALVLIRSKNGTKNR